MRAVSIPDPFTGAREGLFAGFARTRGRHVWFRLVRPEDRDRLVAHLAASPWRLRLRASMVGPAGEVSQLRVARTRGVAVLIDHYRPDAVAIAVRSRSARGLARCLVELDLGIVDIVEPARGHGAP